MKSIVPTPSKSQSNNTLSVSTAVGTHNHRKNDSNRHDIDDANSAVEKNIDKEQCNNNNNKLLNHSNNIKKQVIRNKIIAKDDKLLKRVASSSDNNRNNCEDQQQRWLKINFNTAASSCNNNSGNNNTNNIIHSDRSDNNITSGGIANDSLTTNLEKYPLLIDSNVISNESDSKIQKSSTTTTAVSTNLINLRKKNGTTLIFQRKNCSQPKQQSQQQQQQPASSASEYQELKKESFKKRHSLQWPQGVALNSTSSNKFDNRNRHSYSSWYDSRYPHAIEEEFENSPLTQFANDDNLAEIKTIAASSVLSIASDDYDYVPDHNSTATTKNENNSIMKTSSIDNSITPTAGTTTTKRWRIEQFLKSLVGKRSSNSSSSTTIEAVTATTATIMSSSSSSNAFQKVTKSPSAYDLLPQKSSRYGSTQSLNKDRQINNSTASLNSTSMALVHQKLWSVVPLLNRRDGGSGGASCNNLLANLNENVSQSGSKMRKCETVLALTDEACNRNHHHHNRHHHRNYNHSKSINSLLEPMPMRPLNRLRNSQSCYVNCEQQQNLSQNHQTCSRCSSLLSLAAIGDSNYSLTNGAFVLKNGKKAKRNSVRDDDLITAAIVGNSEDDSGSNHNLIENDFNSIEPYEAMSVMLPLVKGHKQHISTSSSLLLETANVAKFTCKLCLGEFFNEDKLTTITSCGCIFCTECMRAYVEFEISEGAYELSCPDALCSSQGVVSIVEISQLASTSLVAKHHRYRLNREVELDKYRLWCPNRNCETICSVIPTNEKLSSPSSSSAIQQQPSSSSTATLLLPRSVLCPTCNLDFCSSCKKAWHPLISCEENSKRLGSRNDSMMLFDNDLIKNCPMCAVPIEKDEGCAQMMCKRCKHVFCWYCLASLDDDFLLRHYDKGPCKNKLGHSRASVVWHRAQVIGIFAGFGILLLVASPLLLLAAPCIVCCKCKIEESTTVTKLDEPEHHSDHQV